ncbi:MAG: hypothetical protein KDL31_11630 [Kiritimatiellae bacterium]|nr:hypothetical protein [Kiritimatiellia bacterium]
MKWMSPWDYRKYLTTPLPRPDCGRLALTGPAAALRRGLPARPGRRYYKRRVT